MTLGDAIADELPLLRREAEARMLDTFDVEVAPQGWVYDKTTGKDVQQTTLLFTTPGRVKVAGGLSAHTADAGGRAVTTATRELHIPVDSPAVPTGAVAVCTAVDPTTDPTLLGARLRLEGPAPGSQVTARRLEVSEVLT